MQFSKVGKAGVVAGALLAAASFLGAGAASARDRDPGPHPCFFITQWQGWSAPTPDELLLKVNNHDIYRVELSGPSPMLQAPGVHLDSRVIGSDSICAAIDLQLQVSDGHGFREPLIAQSLTKLTPEEVAAIPRKYLP